MLVLQSTSRLHFKSGDDRYFVKRFTVNFSFTGSLGVVVGRFNNAKSPFFDTEGNLNPEKGTYQLRYYHSEPVQGVVNVSGAGDSFSSGIIAAMLRGLPEDVCISVGFEAATQALHSKNAVAEFYFDSKHGCWNTAAPYQEMKLF